LVIAGDFNCSVGSRFYKLFADCARGNNLRMTDISRLGNTFTYYNSDGSICTWIDHVLNSPEIDELVDSCYVQYDSFSSDHKPVITVFKNLYPKCSQLMDEPPAVSRDVSEWSRANSYCIAKYQYELDLALRQIDIPIILDDQETANKIDQYYDNVMLCIREACLKTIPHRTISCSCNDFVIPDWNECVRDKHTAARNAFLDWTFCGKPRSGPSHNIMKTTQLNLN